MKMESPISNSVVMRVPPTRLAGSQRRPRRSCGRLRLPAKQHNSAQQYGSRLNITVSRHGRQAFEHLGVAVERQPIDGHRGLAGDAVHERALLDHRLEELAFAFGIEEVGGGFV